MHLITKVRRVAVLTSLATLAGLALAVVPVQGASAQDKPTISVTSVDLTAGTIEITNHGDAEVDPNGVILCNFPAYAPIEGADVIPPGGSIVVDSGAHGVALDPGSGEMGLYTEPAYENPDAIISYVEWGDPGHQRAPVAIAAGIWSDGAVDPAAGVLVASTTSPVGPADWGAADTAAEDDAAGDAEAAGGAAGETEQLATTGTNAAAMVGAAVTLIAVGGLLAAMSRRRRLA